MITIKGDGERETIFKIITSDCVADDLPMNIQRLVAEMESGRAKRKKEKDCGCKKTVSADASQSQDSTESPW